MKFNQLNTNNIDYGKIAKLLVLVRDIKPQITKLVEKSQSKVYKTKNLREKQAALRNLKYLRLDIQCLYGSILQLLNSPTTSSDGVSSMSLTGQTEESQQFGEIVDKVAQKLLDVGSKEHMRAMAVASNFRATKPSLHQLVSFLQQEIRD